MIANTPPFWQAPPLGGRCRHPLSAALVLRHRVFWAARLPRSMRSLIGFAQVLSSHATAEQSEAVAPLPMAVAYGKQRIEAPAAMARGGNRSTPADRDKICMQIQPSRWAWPRYARQGGAAPSRKRSPPEYLGKMEENQREPYLITLSPVKFMI